MTTKLYAPIQLYSRSIITQNTKGAARLIDTISRQLNCEWAVTIILIGSSFLLLTYNRHCNEQQLIYWPHVGDIILSGPLLREVIAMVNETEQK